MHAGTQYRPRRRWLAALCALAGGGAQAQVVTDGSLGAAAALAGPNYFIDQGLGQTRGANLFHSFSAFTIGANQLATFMSTPGVANIIARVTGSAASQIHGALNADANLFLLNPRGVLFGAGAELNVAGSLHVSTADYLRFGDGARFHASLGGASTLSVAAPSAFGFLDADNGAIAVHGAELLGARGASLSFIGGDVSFDGAALSLERGRLNLVAAGSPGEAVLQAGGVDASGFDAMGSLRLDGSLINAFDEDATSIYIRAGQFVLQDQSLLAASTHDAGGAVIDVDVDVVQLRGSAIGAAAFGAVRGPSIRIRAQEVDLGQTSAVAVTSDSSGGGGDLTVDARRVRVSGGLSVLGTGAAGGAGAAGDLTIRADVIEINDGALSAVSAAAGDAGDIRLSADRVLIGPGGVVTSGATGAGDGGEIFIETRELSVAGSSAAPAVVSVSTNSVRSDAGDAGAIHLDVDALDMREGHITSSTAGGGDGGAVTVQARLATLGQAASISTETGVVGAFGPAPAYGAGGAIVMTADAVQLSSGARVSANTYANGAGGAIAIEAGRLVVTGSGTRISADTGAVLASDGTGAGGAIRLDGAAIEVRNGAAVSANTYGRGDAGRVEVQGGQATVASGASISASAFGQTPDAGDANDIHIETAGLSVFDSGRITNATHGAGDGGRLRIQSGAVLIESGGLLETSSLSPNAGAGGVGELFVGADQLILRGGGVNAINAGGGAPAGLSLQARAISLEDGAVVSTLSTGAGNAGGVGVAAAESLTMTGFSRITTEAQQGAGGAVGVVVGNRLAIRDSVLSTSVLGGDADSGAVLIDAQMVLLDDATISARAVSGAGGSIDLAADFLLRNAATVIDASSALGVDGRVELFGFDVSLDSDIAPLPADFLDARAWLSQPCTRRPGDRVSAFTVRGRDGAWRAPGDFSASPPMFADRLSVDTILSAQPAFDAVGLLAHSGCR